MLKYCIIELLYNYILAAKRRGALTGEARLPSSKRSRDNSLATHRDQRKARNQYQAVDNGIANSLLINLLVQWAGAYIGFLESLQINVQ